MKIIIAKKERSPKKRFSAIAPADNASKSDREDQALSNRFSYLHNDNDDVMEEPFLKDRRLDSHFEKESAGWSY